MFSPLYFNTPNQGVIAYKSVKQTCFDVGNWAAIAGAGGGLATLTFHDLLPLALTTVTAVQYAVAMGLRVIAMGNVFLVRRHAIMLIKYRRFGREKFA
jgi:hypothetical protein